MFAATGVIEVMDVILIFSFYSCSISLSNISKNCFYSVLVEQTVPFSRFHCVVSECLSYCPRFVGTFIIVWPMYIF